MGRYSRHSRVGEIEAAGRSPFAVRSRLCPVADDVQAPSRLPIRERSTRGGG